MKKTNEFTKFTKSALVLLFAAALLASNATFAEAKKNLWEIESPLKQY